MSGDGVKTCVECGRALPLDQFRRHSRTSDGYAKKCRECHKPAPRVERPELPPDTPQTCVTCGAVKTVADFYQNPRRFSCKDCCRARMRADRVRRNMNLPERTIPETKACSTCRQVKPNTDFYRKPESTDGLHSRCKTCHREGGRRKYFENHDQRKAQNLEYRKANKDKIREANRDYQKRNRAKIRQKKREYRDKNRDHVRDYHARYQRENADKLKAQARAYRQRNWDTIYAKKKAYRDANRGLVNAYFREYKRANIKKFNNWSHARRARLYKSGVFRVTDKELARLYAGPCALCGSTSDIQVDHVIPVARGGRHSIGNLQSLCATCNQSKGDRLMVEVRYGRPAATRKRRRK